MRLTVGICTYNPEVATLVRAVDAVVAQVDGELSAEVIVVDNNSAPSLASQGALDGYKIRLISEPTPGLTAAREAVINNAAGDVIVFVDDDNVLDEDYLANAASAFEDDSRLGLLGGRILPEYDAEPPEWFNEFEHWLAIRRYEPQLYVETTAPPFSSHFPVGAGIAVRRDLALAYLRDCAETSRIEGRRGDALSSGEDLDLGLFVLSREYKLAVSGKLSLTHVIPKARTSKEYIEKLARGSVESALALERKWAPRFGGPIYSSFALPLRALMPRLAITRVLGLWSPRYKVKYCIYATLSQARFGEGVQSS